MRGEELALNAMRKEFKRLSTKAEKAKAKADEYIGLGSEFVAIHEEFKTIVDSMVAGEIVVKKLEALQARRDRAQKIHAQDFMKLCDAQYDAEQDRDALGFEIQNYERRVNRAGS